MNQELVNEIVDAMSQSDRERFDALRDRMDDADAAVDVVWSRFEREERGE